MQSLRRGAPWGAAALVGLVAAGACGDEEVAGEPFNSDGAPPPAVVGGLGGQQGGGMGGMGGTGGMGGESCFVTCDPENPPAWPAGDYPPGIDLMFENCRRCHTDPLQNFAPFPLDTYEQSQGLTSGGFLIWLRMKFMAIDNDFMPAQPPALTPDEKDLLAEWICQCAPPAEFFNAGGGGDGGDGGDGGGGSGGGGSGGTGGM